MTLPDPEQLAQRAKAWLAACENLHGWGGQPAIPKDLVRDLLSTIEGLRSERDDAVAFVERCHELGATDTDIVKHALEDQARMREELVPLSIAEYDARKRAKAAEAEARTLRQQLEAVIYIRDGYASRLEAQREALAAYVAREQAVLAWLGYWRELLPFGSCSSLQDALGVSRPQEPQEETKTVKRFPTCSCKTIRRDPASLSHRFGGVLRDPKCPVHGNGVLTETIYETKAESHPLPEDPQ